MAYTGTHDNDTTQGWWKTASKAEREAVEALVGPVGDRPAWPLIRAVEASVAQMAIVPAQDLLELGSEARMNTPAVADRQLELARAGKMLDGGVGGATGRAGRGHGPGQRSAGRTSEGVVRLGRGYR